PRFRGDERREPAKGGGWGRAGGYDKLAGKRLERGGASHATQRTGEFRRCLDLLPRLRRARANADPAHARRQLLRLLRLGRRRRSARGRPRGGEFRQAWLRQTGWSPSKDYSVDANMGDMLAVIAELKWERPIVVGHSASGRLSISFAANFPDKISRLVVVDSGLAREEGGGSRPPVGNPPLVFETVEAAMAHFAKLSNPPRISHDRERALAALVNVANASMLKHHPNFQHTHPQP